MVYGYIRVSACDQNESRQLDAMSERGISGDRLFIDKCSGKDFDRPEYLRMMRRIKRGDRVVVKSIDRLGRNYNEIIEEWKRIVNSKGADIEVLDMPLLDTSARRDLIGTLISDMVLQLLSFVAENERENIRRRQAEGIAAAKRRGVQFGRPLAELPDGFVEAYSLWEARKMTAAEAAHFAGMSTSTFKRRAQKLREESLELSRARF